MGSGRKIAITGVLMLALMLELLLLLLLYTRSCLLTIRSSGVGASIARTAIFINLATGKGKYVPP